MPVSEQLTASQTSSIGAVWPPRPTGHGRIRGFYTGGVITTADEVNTFAEAFEAHRQEMLASDSADRLTIRLVADASAIPELERAGANIEAAMPLANTEPGLAIVYTAANNEGRRMSAQHLAGHAALLNAAIDRPLHEDEGSERLADQGLTVRLVDRERAQELAPAFLPLYEIFDYNLDEVTELLANPDNTIVYAADGDTVVSTAMAESAVVDIQGLEPIRLTEITEASTHPGYRGRGLYQAVSGLLIRQIVETLGNRINLLYGESNLAMPGVVFAAHENGRRFSRFEDYGVQNPRFGILEQNVHIADGSETRRYNDFAPSYVPL